MLSSSNSTIGLWTSFSAAATREVNQLIADIDIETPGHCATSLAGRCEADRCGREQPAGRFDARCNFSLIGKVQLVFAGEYLVREVAQSIVSNGSVPLRAEDQPHWRALMRMGPMLAGVIQIQIHLAGIRVCEFTQLQIHDDEGPKPAVEENQIDTIPFGPDAQPLLSGDEREIIAQLQKKLLDALDERIFEFRLRIFVF